MPFASLEKKREYQKKYREKHKKELTEYQKKYRSEHKDQIKKTQKEYYNNNRDEILKQKKEYYEDNNEQILEYKKEYYEEHKEEIQKKNRKYNQEHIEEIAEYRQKNRDKMRQYRQSPAKFSSYFEKFSPYYKLNIDMRRDKKHPELIQFRCKYCDGWFNPTVQQLDARYKAIIGTGSGGDAELYCSDGCKKSCPIFNQKKWPKGFKQTSSREVQPELRKMVFQRDEWTCQKCGKKKEDDPELVLHCHHIFPLNEDPVCSADLDSCETLCIDCHKWIHMNVPGCRYHEMQCH